MSTDPRFQIAVEAPDEAVRLIRIAGDLDRAAAARLLRLVDAQLDLVAARHRSVSHVLVDLECVRSFEPGGLDAVREARRTGAARGVRLHLVGCAGRSPLLPLRVCQVLAEFSTFPTVEIALAELSRTCATAPPETAALVRAEEPAVVPPQQRPDGPGDLGGPAPRPAPPSPRGEVEVPCPRARPRVRATRRR